MLLTVSALAARCSSTRGVGLNGKVGELDMHEALEPVAVPYKRGRRRLGDRRVIAQELIVERRAVAAMFKETTADVVSPPNFDLN